MKKSAIYLATIGLVATMSFAAEAKTMNELRAMLRAPDTAAEALAELEEKGEAGNAFAMLLTGDAYLRGQGVEKDEARALYWYERSAQEGNPVAAGKAGNLIQKNTVDPRAMEYWRIGAARGDAASLARLHKYEPNEVVRMVQGALEGKGFPAGGVDGYLGPKTWSAIGAFCEDQKIKECGTEFDQKLFTKVGRKLFK